MGKNYFEEFKINSNSDLIIQKAFRSTLETNRLFMYSLIKDLYLRSWSIENDPEPNVNDQNYYYRKISFIKTW